MTTPFAHRQDFEALSPNLLCRTIETVEGGGIVVLLLRTVSSLQQFYTMAMVRAAPTHVVASPTYIHTHTHTHSLAHTHTHTHTHTHSHSHSHSHSHASIF
jgi:tRNA(Met) C34 N-acetyltransferase TmcA